MKEEASYHNEVALGVDQRTKDCSKVDQKCCNWHQFSSKFRLQTLLNCERTKDGHIYRKPMCFFLEQKPTSKTNSQRYIHLRKFEKVLHPRTPITKVIWISIRLLPFMCSDQLAFEIANVRQFPLVTANAQNTAKENKCIHTTTLNRIMAPHTRML